MSNIPTDSPVLQSIQPCLLDLVDSKESEILYANEFSGISPVDMSPELRAMLDSDFGEVGPNLLIQLQKKMRAVPGGPWYIDSRDGCIYIHNRNFNDIPLYTYSYKANSGELLDVSFKTNYVTKRTSGGLLSGVDHNKDVNTEVAFSNLDMTTLKGSDWTQARQVARNKEVNEREKRIASGQYDTETRYGQRYVTFDQAEAWYKEGGMKLLNSRVNQARVAAYLDAMSVPELQREVTPILEQVATNRGITISQLREELKTAMVDGNLEQYLKRIFGNSMHTFNAPDPYHPTGGYPNTFQVYEMDLFNNSFTGNSLRTHYAETDHSTKPPSFDTHTYRGAKEYADYLAKKRSAGDPKLTLNTSGEQVGKDRVKTLLDRLKGKFRNYRIIKEEPLNMSITNKVKAQGYETASFTYSKKITIMVETQNNTFRASTWRLLLNLYTRQIGPEATAKDVEAHVQSLIHTNDETTEKVLSCHMTCMGNPFLESSRVLTLANLGDIWSGRWYIKTCRHNFSSTGYTCQLTLIENRLKVSSTALNTQVKTDKSWDGKSSYDFLLNVTPEEARYYAIEAKSDKDRVEFLLRVLTSRKSDNSDYWDDYGIVRVTSNTSTTSAGDGVGASYSIDQEAPSISDEVRKKYEIPARAAVLNNNFTDIMEQITKENSNK